MTLFLAVAAALALGALAAVLYPLFARLEGVESREVKNTRLYRDQLTEVERDLERGVIGPAEAEGARAEVARRLIAAAERAHAAEAPGRAPKALSLVTGALVLLGLPLLAGIIYFAGGAPGRPDMPFAARWLEPTMDTAGSSRPDRPSQTNAEAMLAEARDGQSPAPASTEDREFAALLARIEEMLDERGPDAQGLTLLANGYARLGRHAEAWRAYKRLIALRGEAAPAEIHALQVEAMVIAADGYVSPEATQAIAAALARDPAQPLARYYQGLALVQSGETGKALAVWQALRDEAPESSPWAKALDGMIAEIRGLPGPDADTMAAAAEMTAAEQSEMIEGMVARLESRLTAEGGEPEEWLRLITSYHQLGRSDDAVRAYEMGREALGPEGGASFLRQQALVLGVIAE